MRNFVEHLAGEGKGGTGRIYIDKGGLNKRVVSKAKKEDLSVKLASWSRVVDGLEKEWEGVKIREHGMQAHAKVE